MKAIPGPYRPERFGFDPKICWGVHVGGCIEMQCDEHFKTRDIDAHAHTRIVGPNSRWKGWICVISPMAVFTRTGRPTKLLLHEYAHLICGDKASHGAEWKRVVTELGAGSHARLFG